MRILAINPGSTSTKISLFEDENEINEKTVRHPPEELAAYPNIASQREMRQAEITRFLTEASVDPETIDAVIGRGGLLKPVSSGIYAVNKEMEDDLLSGRYGEHASNLGGVLAAEISGGHCPAFIADPVVVDELAPEARLSGIPEIPRRSIFHALNQKSAAREACARRGLAYNESNLIVAHLGGGVSVGAHNHGRVVDVNNALDGDGPFSPERAGTVPAGSWLTTALSGEKSEAELRKLLTGRGGLVAYTGSNDLTELRERIAGGDQTAAAAVVAMTYQIAQEIAKHGATLAGAVELIVLTGGMAYDSILITELTARVNYLAPIEIIPGEREMVSLARAAGRALTGEEEIREYQ